ncbi:hypothetical protein PVV74_00980 [Roseovarius sp. SK2]|uniref:hypothetical protein n=1 Tax=Roseovarius TaxID=74030 RepID=UPI0011AF94A1|nr:MULTISPECIES: hypothetical protein [Roseovarius]MDD9724018.1 hypothetical protein [Roseovarius sp. SK2]
MDNKEKELFAKSVGLIERLCHETERLSKDVRRLSGRIQPFEGEKEPTTFSYHRKPKTFREVIDLIEETRGQVQNCEYALNKVSAQIEQIVSDGWSREELKPFLRDT